MLLLFVLLLFSSFTSSSSSDDTKDDDFNALTEIRFVFFFRIIIFVDVYVATTTR